MRKFGAKVSYWEKDIFFPVYDYIIIGSGIVGLNTAIYISKLKPHSKILLIERGPIPTGASTRNAGFSCFGSPSEILDDIENTNEDAVKKTIQLRWDGLGILKEHVAPNQMDYKQNGGYEYYINQENAQNCLSKIDWLNQFIEDAIGLKTTFSEVDNHFNSGSQFPLIFNQYEGQLHPGKMMQQLIKIAQSNKVQIEINSEVKNIIDEKTWVTVTLKSHEERRAQNVIIATNAFASQLVDLEDCQAVRNQVYITSVLKSNPLQGCYHHDVGYVYFRDIDGRILIGGARNRSDHEGVGEFGLSPEIENYLFRFLKEHVLGRKEEFSFEYSWSGILGVGQSKSPIVKKVSPNVIVAVRLGGMGVAIGSMVGKQAAILATS